MKLHYCCPPWKDAFGHHLEKSSTDPLGKNPSHTHGKSCITAGQVDHMFIRIWAETSQSFYSENVTAKTCKMV